MAQITKQQDGKLTVYTLTAADGSAVKVTDLGAAVMSVTIPDGKGVVRDVVLGYEKIESYHDEDPALGKSVGRYANRIAKGRFTLDGREYQLTTNNGPNHLHGGPTGFMNRVWDSRVEGDAVVFSYTAADGEEGYPGKLTIEARYTWSDDHQLKIVYSAVTDKPTIVNITNHTYFNLDGSPNIHDHLMRLNASRYLSTDETCIPTGELAAVEGTPMDFRESKAIGHDIDVDFEALNIGHGYDHCWTIDDHRKGELNKAACLFSSQSSILLEVYTTQPGIQVYTSNWFDGADNSRDGTPLHNRQGVALECQNFPDSPNQPTFPSPVLRPGEKYEEEILFKFSIRTESCG